MLFAITLSVFSCEYVKKRTIKDNLIETYSIQIESLEIEINKQRLSYEQLKIEHDILSYEKDLYEKIINIKKELNQSVENYVLNNRKITLEINEINNILSDSLNQTSLYIREIAYYTNKIDLIKKNQFDYDYEIEEISELTGNAKKKIEDLMTEYEQTELETLKMNERNKRLQELNKEYSKLIYDRINK